MPDLHATLGGTVRHVPERRRVSLEVGHVEQSRLAPCGHDSLWRLSWTCWSIHFEVNACSQAVPMCPTLVPEDAGQPLREVFNGLRHLVRHGVAWRAMPDDFPPSMRRIDPTA
jgi:hypothetical protein